MILGHFANFFQSEKAKQTFNSNVTLDKMYNLLKIF